MEKQLFEWVSHSWPDEISIRLEDVTLLRDIGMFSKGETVTSAIINYGKGQLTLNHNGRTWTYELKLCVGDRIV